MLKRLATCPRATAPSRMRPAEGARASRAAWMGGQAHHEPNFGDQTFEQQRKNSESYPQAALRGEF